MTSNITALLKWGAIGTKSVVVARNSLVTQLGMSALFYRCESYSVILDQYNLCRERKMPYYSDGLLHLLGFLPRVKFSVARYEKRNGLMQE